MVIPFLIFVGICAIAMIGIAIEVLLYLSMILLMYVARLISGVTKISDEAAIKLTIVLVGVIITTLVIMSEI